MQRLFCYAENSLKAPYPRGSRGGSLAAKCIQQAKPEMTPDVFFIDFIVGMLKRLPQTPGTTDDAKP